MNPKAAIEKKKITYIEGRLQQGHFPSRIPYGSSIYKGVSVNLECFFFFFCKFNGLPDYSIIYCQMLNWIVGIIRIDHTLKVDSQETDKKYNMILTAADMSILEACIVKYSLWKSSSERCKQLMSRERGKEEWSRNKIRRRKEKLKESIISNSFYF